MANMPTDEIALTMMNTNSVWGTDDISQDLKDKLTKNFKTIETFKDNKGKVITTEKFTKENAWSLLGFYTRDMRLANLSSWDNELVVCRYYIDLANDLLHEDLLDCFLVSLSRSATILETSQSKGGFFRKIMNTLIQDISETNKEPPKKGFFGGNKEGN